MLPSYSYPVLAGGSTNKTNEWMGISKKQERNSFVFLLVQNETLKLIDFTEETAQNVPWRGVSEIYYQHYLKLLRSL